MPWGDPHPTTGDAIPICYGGNDGHCTEASEVVKHRLRRPGKMAGPGDPDYVNDGPTLTGDMEVIAGDLLPKGGDHLTPIALL